MVLGEDAMGKEKCGKRTVCVRKGRLKSDVIRKGSTDYERMQKRISESDERKIRRTMKHTPDSGH